MKIYLSLTVLLFVLLGVGASHAQTTISLTARGDLSSSFGSARFDSDKIGTRASFGLEAVRKVKDNQAVIGGLEYAIGGTDFERFYVVTDRIDPILGPIDRLKVTGASRYDFLAIPIGYRWYGAEKNWRLYGQLSVIPMAYLRTISSSRFEGQDRTTESQRDSRLRDFHIASSIAGGVERVFENGWTLGLQPTFRLHLNSLSDGPRKERLWTAGLQLSVGRRLGQS